MKDRGVSSFYFWYLLTKLVVNMPLVLVNTIRLRNLKNRKKISKPIIHCYTVCWNEERMLPFMLDYYSAFVDRFYIYDNFSTDSTSEVVRKYPNVELLPFDTSNTYDEPRMVELRNTAWKNSRAKADLVIVCDVDEFLYHDNLQEYISGNIREGVTIFRPEGYNMISAEFPLHETPSLLVDKVQSGWQDVDFNKCIMFNPQKIIEINYTAGSHFCYPLGIVKQNTDTALKLLHYKYLGYRYVAERYHMYSMRYSAANSKLQLGVQYLQDKERIRFDFTTKLNKAVKII